MLLDFLEGKKRTLRGTDFLEVVKDIDLNNYDFSIRNKNLIDLYIKPVSDNQYFIIKKRKYQRTYYNAFVCYVDEINKYIYVNKSNLFTEILCYNNSLKEIYSNIFLNKVLGEYRIIDIDKELENAYAARLSIIKKYFDDNYSNLFKDIKNHKYYYQLDSLVEEKVYDCHVLNEKLEIPNIETHFCEDVEVIELVEEFIFNRKKFNERIINEIIYTLKHEFSNYIIKMYSHYIVSDIFEKDEIPNRIRLAKLIYNSIQNGGKSITITYKNKDLILTDKFENKLCRYSLRRYNDYTNVDIEDILKITFGKKVLFEK